MLQFFLKFKRVDFNSRIYIAVVTVISRETCRVLAGVRFLKVAILSVCIIIALVHPSRCLREKREKGCEN